MSSPNTNESKCGSRHLLNAGTTPVYDMSGPEWARKASYDVWTPCAGIRRTSCIFARKHLWKCQHTWNITDRTLNSVTFKWADVCSASRVLGQQRTGCQWSSRATCVQHGSCYVADDDLDTDDGGLHEQVSSGHCATNARCADACWWARNGADNGHEVDSCSTHA